MDAVEAYLAELSAIRASGAKDATAMTYES